MGDYPLESVVAALPAPCTRVMDRLRSIDVLSVDRLSVARAAAGISMIATPRMLPTALGVDSATATRMTWTTQMLGAREVALGAGTWASLRNGDRRATRLWLLAGLLSDAVDALAIGAAVRRGRVSRVTGGAVVAIAGAAVYTQLDALSSQ
ncbi:MAG: hypothetical protein NVS3B26_06570 [Mycobacteriales bacterium]